MAQQIPPPAPGMSPQQYYQNLVSRGVPGWAAYDAVTQNYGTPQQAQERAAEDAQPGAGYGYGQVAGYLGGALVGREIVTGGENVRGLFGSETPSKGMTTDPSMATPRGISATSGGAGATTGATSSNLPAIDSSFNWQTPDQFQYTPEGNAVIDTPIGKQEVPPTMANNTEFLEGVNWGAVANGTVSLMQAYQAYNSYKSGDKVGAGVYGAGAVTAGSAAASSAGVGGSTTSTIGAWAPYAGVAAGLYGGYQTAKMIGDSAAGSKRTQQGAMGGAAAGAAMGSFFGPWGTAIGAVVGGAAGAIGSWTGSHKGKAQFMRDKIRGSLKEGGILNEDYQGTLADGTEYNFGDDGKSMKWKEIDKIAAANPNSWGETVGLTGAIANAYGFVRPSVNQKPSKMADVSAWYGKAAVSNAGDDPTKAIANVRHFAKQQGITYELIKAKLDQGLADNVITQDQYNTQLEYGRRLTENLYTPEELQQIQQGQPISSADGNKMGTYKPGQNLETLASAAGKPTPSTAIAKQPLSTTRDQANRAAEAISGNSSTNPAFAKQPTTPQPGTSRNQQAMMANMQSLAPSPKPQQWSKEAMQRELARRLERNRR